MKRRDFRMALPMIVALGFAGPAAAQETSRGYSDELEAEDEDEEEEEGAESGGAPPQLSEVHVVETGDTLWDLCAKYLNSPWYWPKIWSYNPQITNPHWVYPGNELRFYPSDENLPAQIDAGSTLTIGSDVGLNDGMPGYLGPTDYVRTLGDIHTGNVAESSVIRSNLAYVAVDDRPQSGVIVASTEESPVVSVYDQVYLRTRDAVQVGDEFLIYRALKEIEHPVNGRDFGKVMEILGMAKVVATSAQVATAEIFKSFRPIRRGDYIGPVPENFGQRIAPVAADVELKGYIVDAMEEALDQVADHNIVFVDRGRSDGVRVGNVFKVYARGDRFTGEVDDLPNEEVGAILVLDVRDAISTGIIIRSVRELHIGDKIAIRPN